MMKRLQRTSPALLTVLLTLGAAVLLSIPFVTGALTTAWWIPMLISVGLGYASARLLSPLLAIPVAAAAPATAVCLVILIKALVWPHVPAVGDGFHILLMVFAVVGAVAAAMTLLSAGASAPLRRVIR